MAEDMNRFIFDQNVTFNGLPADGSNFNDAGHATGGVGVFSTQFFQFSATPGAETLVSQGDELADLNTTISRAITGGSGVTACSS